MKQLVWGLAIGALVSVGAVGCGSTTETSSGGTTTTTAAPTTTADPAAAKAEFVTKANAVCVQLAKDTSDLKIDTSAAGGSVAEKAPAITKSADLLQKAVDDMKALPQPKGDEATLTGIYDGLTQAVALQRQQATAATTNDLQGINSAQDQLKALATQANAASATYGLDECAK